MQDPVAAQQVLAQVGEGGTGPPLTMGPDRTLRVARAQGGTPDWKVCVSVRERGRD